MIAHSIDAALSTRAIDRVVVSTDCPKIAETARKFGAEVPFLRPAELASDDAPERFAWRHAIEQVEELDGKRLDTFVSIPPTCPLRIPDDIDHAVDRLHETDFDMVLTVCESGCNPYFNMVTFADDGACNIAIRPDGRVAHRQEAPRVLELTAVAYAARRDPLFESDYIFGNRVTAIEVPHERAVDVDTEFDLKLVEFLYSQSLTDNQRRAA